MSFTFLHAADLHLGSPFTGLALRDETLARRFAKASRDALSELVVHAIEDKVAFVIIAGDIYDGEWKDTSIGLFFNREMARLEDALLAPPMRLPSRSGGNFSFEQETAVPPQISK
jgi:exonuclease SbcD